MQSAENQRFKSRCVDCKFAISRVLKKDRTSCRSGGLYFGICSSSPGWNLGDSALIDTENNVNEALSHLSPLAFRGSKQNEA